MTSPFKEVEPGSLAFRLHWSDSGSGGKDWSFITIRDTSIPDGFANLGDAIYESHNVSSLGVILPSEFYGVRCLFVAKNRPDVAIPCTGYEITKSLKSSIIYKPICPDQNYIALGHVVRRNQTSSFQLFNGPPKPGEYYLVHRRYLVDLGYTATYVAGKGDIGSCYRTVDGYHLFKYDGQQKYMIRTDAQLRSCCTGSGSSCEVYNKGSTECQLAMSDYCNLDDIKSGGKCEDWCARDPISCDKLKLNLCRKTPLDSYCDCINAEDRADHTELIKGKEIIYRMSLPACYYNKCKLGPDKVFTTTEMRDAQLGLRCAQDLKYIDQQVKVLGDNNVVDADLASSIDSEGGAPGAPGEPNSGGIVGETKTLITTTLAEDDKIAGMQKTTFWIVFSFILLVVSYLLFSKSDNKDSVQVAYNQPVYGMQQQGYGQQPMYGMQQQPMYGMQQQ
jgi:hypothetical protein